MRKIKEGFAHVIFFIAALTSILAVLLICVFLFANGIPAMKEIGLFSFLTGTNGRRITLLLPMEYFP